VADVNRGNRPLSPHLTVFRPLLNMMMSITHRLTGLGLALGAVLVVWWFLAAATGAAYFALVDGLLTSWIGGLILILSLAALWYHFLNGIRHLAWDAGAGFDLDVVEKTGLAVLAGTAILTVVTIFLAF
jgi:succinate dehydrogenase / fumarate reductase cytochrome b subunit